MTPTPDNEAGRLTEQVMAGFKKACEQVDPNARYNRMYEHVYRVLSAEIPKIKTETAKLVRSYVEDGMRP